MKKPVKNPNRIQKVNAFIQKELGLILHEELSDQVGLLTISKVETSRDMKWAKIWISVLGTSKDEERLMKFLNANIYHIQGELNKKFSSKIIPRIQFFLDTSASYAQHIEEIIKKLSEEEPAGHE